MLLRWLLCTLSTLITIKGRSRLIFLPATGWWALYCFVSEGLVAPAHLSGIWRRDFFLNRNRAWSRLLWRGLDSSFNDFNCSFISCTLYLISLKFRLITATAFNNLTSVILTLVILSAISANWLKLISGEAASIASTYIGHLWAVNNLTTN